MNTEEVFLTNLSLQAEGLTAIECWVIACIIFVFGALLEYTVILLKLKLKKVRASKKETRQLNGSTNVENETLVSNNGKPRSRKKSATSGILNWEWEKLLTRTAWFKVGNPPIANRYDLEMFKIFLGSLLRKMTFSKHKFNLKQYLSNHFRTLCTLIWFIFVHNINYVWIVEDGMLEFQFAKKT